MPVKVFQDQEKEYMKWLASHPKGYVVNTTKSRSIKYMVVHTSTCHSISSNPEKEWKFTGPDYIKICSDDPGSLQRWIKQQGGSGFTKVCRICNPDVTKVGKYSETDNNPTNPPNRQESARGKHIPSCEDLQSTIRKRFRPGDKVSKDTVLDWYENNTTYNLKPDWREIVCTHCDFLKN